MGMTSPPGDPSLLIDASVLVSAAVGRGDGPSALVVATACLGGLVAITVENAIEETRRRLLEIFNADRLKIDFSATDKRMAYIRGALTTVHPWITPPDRLWEENPDDAYLLEAIQRYRPSVLLTLDSGVRALEEYQGTTILQPKELLALLVSGDGLSAL